MNRPLEGEGDEFKDEEFAPRKDQDQRHDVHGARYPRICGPNASDDALLRPQDEFKHELEEHGGQEGMQKTLADDAREYLDKDAENHEVHKHINEVYRTDPHIVIVPPIRTVDKGECASLNARLAAIGRGGSYAV